MNSQFFSIDSLIGPKTKVDEDKDGEHVEEDDELSEPIDVNIKDHDSKHSPSEGNHRRLKIPSYHTSIPEPKRVDRPTNETSSTDTCYSSACGASHKHDTTSRCDEHRSDTCPNSCKGIPKQKRLSLTKHQLGELEKCFLKNYYPTEAKREDLAVRLGLSHARVKVWFQNRRAKWQRNQKMKSEWQSLLHHPFATALGLSHHRLLLQQQQLLTDSHTKEYDTQCLQTPITPFYSPFTHNNLAFMFPRQDLMPYAIGAKSSLQGVDAYMLAKQASPEQESSVKNSASDESDSEETSKTTEGYSSPSPSATDLATSARSATEKNNGLPPGQFWW